MLDIARRPCRDARMRASVVHFNNAGAALQPRPVVDAVREHLDAEMRGGGYEAADAAMERLVGTYALAGPADRRRPPTRSRSSRTPRAPGTWPSTASRFRPGDRVLTSRERVRQQRDRLPARRTRARHQDRGRARTTSTARSASTRSPRRSTTTCASSRSTTCRRTTGWSTRSPRSGGCRARSGALYLARRLPVRRAARRRRRGDRLRPAVRDRAQVPARAARHRLPLRTPRGARPASPRRSWTTVVRCGPAPESYTMHDDARRFES